MKDKIILVLFILLSLVLLLKIKDLREDKALLNSQIQLNQTKQRQNLRDLRARNEELSIRNQELKELYEITQNIKNPEDCINQPIHADVVGLLKKANL